MNKKKMKNSKGFSLVELIIVIAIMAVLIAILAPAFIKYVESSRQNSDLSAVDDIIKAVKTSVAAGELELNAEKEIEMTTTETKVKDPSDTDLANALSSADVYGTKAHLKSSKWGTVSIKVKSTSAGGVDATVTSPGNGSGGVKMQDKYGK